MSVSNPRRPKYCAPHEDKDGIRWNRVTHNNLFAMSCVDKVLYEVQPWNSVLTVEERVIGCAIFHTMSPVF
jgi:hypothetical protein